jgi:hypothetical protein
MFLRQPSIGIYLLSQQAPDLEDMFVSTAYYSNLWLS